MQNGDDMRRHKNKRKSIIPQLIGILVILGGGIATYLAVNTDVLDDLTASVSAQTVATEAEQNQIVETHEADVAESSEEAAVVVEAADETDIVETNDEATASTASSGSAIQNAMVTFNTSSTVETASNTVASVNMPEAEAVTDDTSIVDDAIEEAETDELEAASEAMTDMETGQVEANPVEAAANTEMVEAEADALEAADEMDNPTMLSETLRVTTGARARACPETSCNVVFTVRMGLTVTLIDTTQGQAVYGDNGQWMEVEFEGQQGFIYSDLLASVE